MAFILSFDCGVVNMGITLVYSSLKDILTDSELLVLLTECIHIADDDSNELYKALCLRRFTKTLNEKILELLLKCDKWKSEKTIEEQLIIVIESQPGINRRTNAVMNQLFYEYAEHSILKIEPSYKNQIELDPNTSYADFLLKYSDKYTANKMHAVNNFKYVLTQKDIKLISHFSIKKITAKKMRDIADAFMNSVAAIENNLKDNPLYKITTKNDKEEETDDEIIKSEPQQTNKKKVKKVYKKKITKAYIEEQLTAI